MYITNKTNQYPCTGYFPTTNEVRFSGVDGVTLPIVGEIKLCRDDGFGLATQTCENYARQIYENNTLTITNEPEPVVLEPTEPANMPPTLEERTTALETTTSGVVDVLASALGVTI